MKFYDKAKVSFHHGDGYSKDGIEKKPFAVFVFNEIIDAEIINKFCDLMKEFNNEIGENCNVKMTIEDWDC